jgi:hypothetical protein
MPKQQKKLKLMKVGKDIKKAHNKQVKGLFPVQFRREVVLIRLPARS